MQFSRGAWCTAASILIGVSAAACSSAAKPAASATTNPGATSTTVTATPSSITRTTVGTTTVAVAGEALPISVSSQLTSDQQDSSVLVPSSCQLYGGVLTAQGTVTGVLPEVYRRYGDVVELYAYNTTDNPLNGANDIQVL